MIIVPVCHLSVPYNGWRIRRFSLFDNTVAVSEGYLAMYSDRPAAISKNGLRFAKYS
jgi:hypothetical protein